MGEDVLDQVEDDDEEDFDPASTLVEVVSMYPGTVKFNLAGRKYKLKQGQVERVEGAYGTPRLMRPNTDPLPSVVELLTNRKVLPVLDPRVDKDSDGVPLVSIEMLRRREADKAIKHGATPS